MTEPETSSILHPSPKAQKASSIALSSILYKLIFFIALIAIFFFTRDWELLHLLFVGIAVSYGIFSQRNADAGMEKDSQQKDESPRSVVSQMLQVLPVFDDEDDSGGGVVDSEMQSWNRSNYESKAQLSEPRTDSVVLPSPIPWSLRSESPANKVEQAVAGSKSTTTLPPHRPSSTSPSPKRLSLSPSLSSDAAKPKSIKASPPPAPPPPPPFPQKRKDTAKTCDSPEGPSTGRPARTLRSKQSQSDEQREGGDEEETPKENEVDKRADEFIAKFREQIRLQRIESIKRSTKPRCSSHQIKANKIP